MIDNPLLYSQKLAQEWIDWVESDDPEGSRQKEIYPILKKWLTTIQPKTLVDIGCGQGICSRCVSPKIKYLGVDPSKELIGRAKKLYSNSKRKFILGDAYKIPLKDQSADAAMSITVWSHLRDLKQAAKEMNRILKPGGYFLIITANPATYTVRKTFYKHYQEHEGWLLGTFDLGGGKTLTDTTLYLHSRKDILSALEMANLQVDSVEAIGLREIYAGGLYLLIKGQRLSD